MAILSMNARKIGLGLVPLVLLLAAMMSLQREGTRHPAMQLRAFEPAKHFRSVVFILDSAGKSEMFDPELMPFLASLRPSSVSGRARSCATAWGQTGFLMSIRCGVRNTGRNIVGSTISCAKSRADCNRRTIFS